jgi:hypothetical protein
MTRKFAVFLLLSGAMAWAQADQPPQSQDQQQPPSQQQRGHGRRADFQGTGGTITAISGDTLTLKTMSGGTATIKLTSSTVYRRDRQDAKLTDFKVGDMVMVRGEPAGENTWTAQGVMSNSNGMAMREQLGKKFIAGDIAKIEDTKLTIKRIDGETQVIQVDENTSFRNAKRESVTLADVKVGDRVFGRGDLKDGVFVPAVLNVGAPGEMMMRRGGNDQRQGPTPQPEAQPQQQ